MSLDLKSMLCLMGLARSLTLDRLQINCSSCSNSSLYLLFRTKTATFPVLSAFWPLPTPNSQCKISVSNPHYLSTKTSPTSPSFSILLILVITASKSFPWPQAKSQSSQENADSQGFSMGLLDTIDLINLPISESQDREYSTSLILATNISES